MVLDALFNHPNTGPFICSQLIQRLVTSNPSPAYVYRVAQVFDNDGTGTRGNLAAVVKAILLDYEARSLTEVNNSGYGKLKEPLLRMTGIFRAFKAASAEGRFPIFNPRGQPGPGRPALPDRVQLLPPGLRAAGHARGGGAPRPGVPDNHGEHRGQRAQLHLLQRSTRRAAPSASTIVLDLSSLTANASNPAAMVATLKPAPVRKRDERADAAADHRGAQVAPLQHPAHRPRTGGPVPHRDVPGRGDPTMNTPYDLTRRRFIGRACAAVGATGMLSALAQLRMIGALAADSAPDRLQGPRLPVPLRRERLEQHARPDRHHELPALRHRPVGARPGPGEPAADLAEDLQRRAHLGAPSVARRGPAALFERQPRAPGQHRHARPAGDPRPVQGGNRRPPSPALLACGPAGPVAEQRARPAVRDRLGRPPRRHRERAEHEPEDIDVGHRRRPELLPGRQDGRAVRGERQRRGGPRRDERQRARDQRATPPSRTSSTSRSRTSSRPRSAA